MYFPGGLSTKGNWNDFDVELLDHKSHKCNLDLTFERMFDLSALTTLRVYLLTTQKSGITLKGIEDDFIPETVTRSGLEECSSSDLQDSPTFYSQNETTSFCKINGI